MLLHKSLPEALESLERAMSAAQGKSNAMEGNHASTALCILTVSNAAFSGNETHLSQTDCTYDRPSVRTRRMLSQKEIIELESKLQRAQNILKARSRCRQRELGI
jgi:hypothetical protein